MLHNLRRVMTTTYELALNLTLLGVVLQGLLRDPVDCPLPDDGRTEAQPNRLIRHGGRDEAHGVRQEMLEGTHIE